MRKPSTKAVFPASNNFSVAKAQSAFAAEHAVRQEGRMGAPTPGFGRGGVRRHDRDPVAGPLHGVDKRFGNNLESGHESLEPEDGPQGATNQEGQKCDSQRERQPFLSGGRSGRPASSSASSAPSNLEGAEMAKMKSEMAELKEMIVYMAHQLGHNKSRKEM